MSVAKLKPLKGVSDVNLLTETISLLEQKGKSPADVRWVSSRDPEYLQAIRPTPTPIPCGSWEEFAHFADFDYNEGYGGAEVNTNLIIVGDDWWLERGEYDGSEWWEFKTLPTKPAETASLRPSDLRDR